MANPQKIKCVVSSIINHDEKVSIVTFKTTRRIPNFLPGQFLHLALDPFDPASGFWPESRVFSIASTPSDPEVTIAYAVKGIFTKRMQDELAVGKEVWIKLPYGHFTMTAAPGKEVILVAGGTGITPFISFLMAEMSQPTGTNLKLVYGVKHQKIFLFKDILRRALSDLPGFQLFAYSEIKNEDCEGTVLPSLFIRQGMLHLDAIWHAAKSPDDATFYLSGPVAMLDALKKGLQSKGITDQRIRIDEWE